jgi:amino acid adenylation domain-containing protein
MLTLSRFASCGTKVVDTIVLGLQHSDRNAQNCIGNFVNTLLIRIHLQKYLDQSFSSFAHDVSLSILSAIEDSIPMKTSNNASVQTICNYHSYSEAVDDKIIVVREPWTVFDIEFHLFEEGNELLGWIRFRKALFSIGLITTLAHSYVSILSQIIESSSIKLIDIPTFSSSYIPHILSLWENTRKMTISEAVPFLSINENTEDSYLIHRRFEKLAQSEEFANRTAIREIDNVNSSSTRTLSYYELLDWARIISTFAIYMEKNAKAVASYLGIMMAGGAYMPLDRKIFPYERLIYVCNNSRTRYLITLKAYANQISEVISINNQLKVLFVDELLQNNNGNLEKFDFNSTINNSFDCHNSAYVYYTSGSTGQPKGVSVTHFNVTSLLDCSYREWKFDSSASIVWFHSPSFDLSGWEMWGALLYGGILTIAPNDMLNSPADLWKFLQQFQISHLSQTPAAFYEFCHYDHLQIEKLSTLIMVMLCGDSLLFSQPDLGQFIQRYGDEDTSISVVNSYGITETTIINSYRRVTVRDVTINIPSTSRIGTALNNAQFLILDDALQPVPPGVPGEMFIAGPCVSKGYLFNEEATANRFSIDNDLILSNFRQYALSHVNLLNLYRTGDIVRFDAVSGDFEFLGRMAHNIKYNGYRIDIMEIEAAINRLSYIKSAVVTLVELNTRSLLVAYVQVQNLMSTITLNIKQMRQQLVRMLPDSWIPTRIIPVNSFPLTDNKKIDRKLLSSCEGLKRYELIVNDDTARICTFNEIQEHDAKC